MQKMQQQPTGADGGQVDLSKQDDPGNGQPPAPPADAVPPPSAPPAPPVGDPNAQQPPPEGDGETRVNSYQKLKAEHAEYAGKIEKHEADLAKFGGLEGFEHIAGVFDAFLDPTGKFTVNKLGPDGVTPVPQEITGSQMIREFVETLPESDTIFSDFFLQGLENIDNRVFAVNDVMKQEFGLRPDANITQDQFNTVFEYLAAKINIAKTAEEVNKVFKDLEFEAKGLDYNAEEFAKDRTIEDLKAKLQRFENPEAGKQEDPAEQFRKSYDTAIQEEGQRIEAENNLLIERYTTAATEFMATYGLAPNEADSPEVKEAKTLLGDLMLGKTNIAAAIRDSAAFKRAAGFLHKNTLTAPSGMIASNSLNNAMRTQVDMMLEKLSPLIAGAQAPAKRKQKEQGDAPNAGIQPSGDGQQGKGDLHSRASAFLGRTVPKY